MIEQTIYDYLLGRMTVPVYCEIPPEKPGTYVALEKTSGGMENRIPSATIAVQSHAPSLFEAAQLNEDVKTAMLEAVELDDVASVRLNSDYNYTDGTLRQYRYQAVFDVTHY